MKITFYQQCAFVINTKGGLTAAFDFGYEVPIEVVRTVAPDVCFCTHLHPDHLHAPYLEAFDAPIYAPHDVLERLDSLAFSKTPIMPGDQVEVGDLGVLAFESDHGPGLSAPIHNVGFALNSGGRRILYLGDMARPSPTPNGPWDAVFVPVGGSKVFSPEAAADFIRQIGHRGLTVPNHYHGRSDPRSGEQFEKIARAFCRVTRMTPGQSLEI